MLVAACLVVTALLLWLAAGIAARANRRNKPLPLLVRVGAAVLVACALWWPPHMLQAQGTLVAADGPKAMLGWLPALGLALVALATARAAAAKSLAGTLAGGVATLAAAYGFAMLMLPGLFRVAPIDLPVGEICLEALLDGLL